MIGHPGSKEVAMQVKELMSRNVVTVGESDSCQEAVRQMYAAKIRHLPVVDGGGRLVGIVTDRDLRHHLFSTGVFKEIGITSVQTILKNVPVSAIMSRPVVSVGPATDLAEAGKLMLDDKIGSLPVVDGERVVGILTETDMLRQIVRVDSSCCPDVEEVIVSFP
jgi:acetoin utilization protein AcuB